MNDLKIQRQIEALLGERDASSRPVWVRAPKDGAVEHYSGLGKGVLYALEAEGVIKSACLKRPGTVRGVRLFQLQSILNYIASRVTTPDQHSSSSMRPSPRKHVNDFPPGLLAAPEGHTKSTTTTGKQ